MSKVFVGIGSNLGDRDLNARHALEEIEKIPLTWVWKVSSLYDSKPVGMHEQPNFLNAVAMLGTELSPRTLLWNLLLIEKRMGRVRSRRWGPRVIDLDLLFYNDSVLNEPDIIVPHQELEKRAFVLKPLVEVDRNFLHPVLGVTVAELLERLDDRDSVRQQGRPYY
jgi:2-amino-4-hydroxy-6-hydroxymethyldihydropteridine diphosphokinase